MADAYAQAKDHRLRRLRKKAKTFGFELKELQKSQKFHLKNPPLALSQRKLIQQLLPPRVRRLHPPQHVLFQNHFIGRCRIHRSRYPTTPMTSLNSGAWRDAYDAYTQRRLVGN